MNKRVSFKQGVFYLRSYRPGLQLLKKGFIWSFLVAPIFFLFVDFFTGGILNLVKSAIPMSLVLGGHLLIVGIACGVSCIYDYVQGDSFEKEEFSAFLERRRVKRFGTTPILGYPVSASVLYPLAVIMVISVSLFSIILN